MAQHKVRRRLYFALSLNVPFILFTLCIFLSSVYLHRSQESVPLTIEIRGNYTETMNFLHYPIYAASTVTWNEGSVIAKVDLETDGLGLCTTNLQHLVFEAAFYDENTIRITLRDADSDRWEADYLPNQRKYWFNNYALELDEYPFAFRVIRKQGDIVLFDTRGKNSSPTLCYTDRYLEFSSKTMPSPLVFGLGERLAPFLLRTDGRNYTLWPNSQVNVSESGIEGKGLSGHHPFYLEMMKDKAHGVFLHSANALEVEFISEKVTFRAAGGIIDLFLFLGTEPEAVLRQYHSIIGRPVLPPYWALGYHQTVNSVGKLQETVRRHKEAAIPLDAIWLDSSSNVSFSLNTLDMSETNLTQLAQDLKEAQIKVVLAITPGIQKTPSKSYTRGEDLNVFLLSLVNEPLVLHTPAQNLSFVDFFHPNASVYWCEMLELLNEQFAFDGVWLEGNEATVDQTQTAPPFPETSFETSFTPDGLSLDYNMLPLRTAHYGEALKSEFNTHSLYGSMSARVTAECLLKANAARPLVVSRSTRAGDGKYMGHVLSGVQSSWEHMRASLVAAFTYQMFGMAFSGADVCGYTGQATEELCTRWVQLGAWLPLFRNHHSSDSQTLYSWSKEAQTAMKAAIQLRYSLASYLYSLHFSVALKGGSVLKPLFFEFPREEGFIRDDQHVMIGPALFFTPIMTESFHESVMSLPSNSVWFSYFTGEKFQGRENLRFFTGLENISLLIKAGNAVTYQDASGVLAIESMRSKPIGALFALDEQRQAKGELYLDDGTSPDSLQQKRYLHVSFRAFKEEFSLVVEISPKYQGYSPKSRLSEIKVYGLHLRVVEEVTVSSSAPTDLTRVHSFTYNDVKGTLVVALDLDLTTLHRIRIS